jgi:DNA-binding response OmpR family regulator
MKTRILVIEDDPHIALGLEEILRREGHEVALCSRGDQALAAQQAQQPGLIVLDVMLPGLNGYDICRQLRAQACLTPILMLTAKGEEIDKVVGLELGADDYLTKPFGVRELVARIQALLRRTQGQGQGAAPANPGSDPSTPFTIGANTVDPRRFELRRGEMVEELTARELKLLRLFHDHPGEVLSRDRLLNEAWGHGYYGTTRTLDQVIVQLRRKLGDRADSPRYLQTVHGVGYRLADPPSPTQGNPSSR